MNNITFSSKFSPQHDNGERALCWKKGMPESGGKFIFTTKYNEVLILSWYNDKLRSDDGFGFPPEDIVAHMKLPTPYKPD